MMKMPASVNNSADLLAVRAAIRREKLAERQALALDTRRHSDCSMKIEQHLADWFAQRKTTSFGFCSAIRGEFDPAPLAKHLIAQGWQAAMAVTVQADSALIFRALTAQETMTIDHHRIPVPQSAVVAAPDILLIPLVAFDAQGFRLGYGGGYFDRTLSALTTRLPKLIAVGIGFALSEVDSVLPQAHDQQLDFLVTENGIRNVNKDALG